MNERTSPLCELDGEHVPEDGQGDDKRDELDEFLKSVAMTEDNSATYPLRTWTENISEEECTATSSVK